MISLQNCLYLLVNICVVPSTELPLVKLFTEFVNQVHMYGFLKFVYQPPGY